MNGEYEPVDNPHWKDELRMKMEEAVATEKQKGNEI